MQPTFQVLCNEEIISICSIADLCTKLFSHEENNVEHIDINVVLHSQEGLSPESAYVHQNNGLQTKCSNLSQDILDFLDKRILVYNEDAMSCDHEECVDILFQKDPDQEKLEQRVVLDEAYYLNP